MGNIIKRHPLVYFWSILGIPIAIPSLQVQAYSNRTTLICSGQKLEFLVPPRSSMKAGHVYGAQIFVNGDTLLGTFSGGNGEKLESNDKSVYFYGYGRNPYLSIYGKKFLCKGNFHN